MRGREARQIFEALQIVAYFLTEHRIMFSTGPPSDAARPTQNWHLVYIHSTPLQGRHHRTLDEIGD